VPFPLRNQWVLFSAARPVSKGAPPRRRLPLRTSGTRVGQDHCSSPKAAVSAPRFGRPLAAELDEQRRRSARLLVLDERSRVRLFAQLPAHMRVGRQREAERPLVGTAQFTRKGQRVSLRKALPRTAVSVTRSASPRVPNRGHGGPLAWIEGRLRWTPRCAGASSTGSSCDGPADRRGRLPRRRHHDVGRELRGLVPELRHVEAPDVHSLQEVLRQEHATLVA